MKATTAMNRQPVRPLLLLALLAGLAGCGGGGDSVDADSPEAKAKARAEAAAEAAAEAGVAGPVWPPMPEGQAPRIDMTRALTTNYYLVLDGSGSMMESECSGRNLKMTVAQRAVKQFISKIPEQANIGLAIFDGEGLSERVPLGVGNRPALKRAIDAVQADQSTPLRSAVELAYERIQTQAVTQSGYGEYHVVVITDGQPDPDSEDPRPIIDTILAESPVVVHTVGFCIGEDHSLNQPGKTLYAAADSPEALGEGLAAVLAEAPSFDTASFQD